MKMDFRFRKKSEQLTLMNKEQTSRTEACLCLPALTQKNKLQKYFKILNMQLYIDCCALRISQIAMKYHTFYTTTFDSCI